MRSNIVDFPLRYNAESKSNVNIAPVKQQDNVIVVDFFSAKKCTDEAQALQELRDAFDEARADWVLDEAEFPEHNKLFSRF
ncbi:hypothetical protein CBF23_002085 [Marinomonas agarivorans]|nr:hypothetical protein CBF23_002085 [Marinomonas agarivorans]